MCALGLPDDLTFYKDLGNSVADVTVKCQSDTAIST